MKLIIAEKPSMGKLIAEALGGIVKKDHMSIELKNDIVITWVAGHLLELYNPDDYNPLYRVWSLESLPIIPNKWKNRVKESAKDLYENIKTLAGKTNHIIHAGDADREGQWIVDSILEEIQHKGSVSRLWINNPTVEGILEAYNKMQENKEYRGFRDAAVARQRSDWLIGMNFTRAYSCALGGRTVSMGRVQTPTLAFVVDRDRAIENFVVKSFYEIAVSCVVSGGQFKARWIPNEEQTALDAEGRLLDRAIATKFVERMTAAVGNISKVERKEVRTPPPLPHAIADLQMECSEKYNLSPAETLSLLQTLYECRLVTYPRSDCPYLPEGLFAEREKTVAMISANCADLQGHITCADLSRKSKAWNDEKLEEHHGIIPTGVMPHALSADQQKVFEVLCRRYLAQFFPDQKHDTGMIELSVKNELFRSTEKREIETGWHALYSKTKRDEGEGADLPIVTRGEQVALRELIIEDKKTTPPKPFTEATLLDAMRNAHKQVQDLEIKKILKTEKGIGTGATQANIIETLFKRGYLIKDGKNIKSTLVGQAVIDVAPESLRKPDMSALWEQHLKEINTGGADINIFIASVSSATAGMIAELKNKEFEPATLSIFKTNRPSGKDEVSASCTACGEKMIQRISTKTGKFWVCSACGLVVSDDRGKPQKVGKCPTCGGNAVRVKGKNGYFWSCRNQDCKKTFNEDAVKPLKQVKRNGDI